MATVDELIKLKQEWIRDPCWDIEDTEGFEDHYSELHEYSLKYKAGVYQRKRDAVVERARELCIEDLNTVEYIMDLESRVERLEEVVLRE